MYNASEEDVSGMVLKLNKMIEDLMKTPPSEISSGNFPQISEIILGAYDSLFYSYASICKISLYFFLVPVGRANVEHIHAKDSANL